MERAKTEFVWHADISVSNEFGELQLLSVSNSGTVEGSFTAADLAVSSIRWALEKLDVDPTMIDVITFTWSDMPKLVA